MTASGSKANPSTGVPLDRPRRVSRQREAGEVTRRETRRRVLAAATTEFAERGFTGATVARIAERAEVAVPTLYAAWGSKRALLGAVMAVAVTGQEVFDAESYRGTLLGPPEAWPAEPAAFLREVAHTYRQIAERSATGWRTYRDGAAVDSDIAADWQQLQLGRRDTFAALLSRLPEDTLRPGLSREDAVDTAWAIASPDTHELFVLRRRWSYHAYETWVADTLCAALLDRSAEPTPTSGEPASP